MMSTWGAVVLLATPLPGNAEPTKKVLPPLETVEPASANPWKRYDDWPKTDWKQYSSIGQLATPAYTPPPKQALPITGDPKNGEKLAFDRGRGGGCVACHIMGKNTPTMPGAVGPDLSTIGSWGRTDEWLFNYVYDARSVNPETVMPPWGAHGLYTVPEIRDFVAFMKTLTEPYQIKDPLENPATRPKSKNDRDNLDPFVNNAILSVERAEERYKKPGPSGKSCGSCHGDANTAFKAWAAGMPKYEPRLKHVLGVEEFVTRHARATTGDDWLMQSEPNLDMAIYLRYLANGMPIKVDTASPGAREAFERGNALLKRKIGQLNFACTDCHEIAADRWIRGQWLGDFKGQVDHFPTWRTSKSEVWDLRRRIQWCNVAVRANELPPDAPEYGDLELALTAFSNGEKLSVPGIRH
jgi:sulfur-oxidizing protein SoxA